MFSFKKEKKDNVSFQEWNNKTNNFGFNERSNKLGVDFDSTLTDSQSSNEQQTANVITTTDTKKQ